YSLGTAVAYPTRAWVAALRERVPIDLRAWPEVAQTGNSCLQVPLTILNRRALEMGMEGLGVAPDPRFREMLTQFLGSFLHKPVDRFVFLDRDTVLLSISYGWSDISEISKPARTTTGLALCVVPIEDGLRHRWREAIDEREFCLSDDLYEAVTGN